LFRRHALAKTGGEGDGLLEGKGGGGGGKKERGEIIADPSFTLFFLGKGRRKEGEMTERGGEKWPPEFILTSSLKEGKGVS